MAQGRGRTTQTATATALLMLALLFLNGELAESMDFTVGDGDGWTFHVIHWPNGKTFHAGDTLEFKYNNVYHNLLKVDSDGYENCKSGNAIATYSSGYERIKLTSGTHYFICGVDRHCSSASMKIKVTVF